MRFRASEVAAITGGTLVGPDVEIDGASIDSRSLRGGELFVPVLGVRDGHAFIVDALEGGAHAYLTARDPQGGTAVVVADPAVALTALGIASRARLPERVIGITGSVGKTSAKDLAAGALARRHRIYASVRSFNNELGVPLTLLNAPDDTEVAVVEMGARGHGHIAELCVVGRPTIGIVTTVEMVHTQLFGELADVARAKGELIESLPPGGVAILNGVNPYTRTMGERTEARVLLFGVEGDDGPGGGGRSWDVRASRVDVDADLRPSFVLHTPWGDAEVRLEVRGRHNVMNALAAASAALVCDVDLADVASGLEEAVASPWRMELKTTADGALLLNDAYNAGPASVEAALRALAHLDAERRVAVLGPMAELGEGGADEHRRIAALADDLGIRVIAVAAPDYGTEGADDLDHALELLGRPGPGDAVLVKGSRVAGLERLAHALLGDDDGGDEVAVTR